MKNIEKNIGSLSIRVDYRTELLGIIELISDYRKKYPHLLRKYANKLYIEQIEDKFMKFSDHKVVEIFNSLVIKHGFAYDAPIALFLQLDENLNCDKLDPHIFDHRLVNDNDVYELIKLLPDFAKEIDFESFYLNNTKRYEMFINEVKNELEKFDFIEFMTGYYGISCNKNFVVNLIPFQTNGNYGANNANNIFASIGVHDGPQKEEEIYKVNGFNLSCLLFHEFSHSFINPLTDQYNLISENNPIFNEVKEKMKKQAYNDNSTIINEHIIRALTMRYIYFSGKEKDYYHRQIQREKDIGFLYIENIINSLIEYENNRTIYKTISDYYPVIITNIIK